MILIAVWLKRSWQLMTIVFPELEAGFVVFGEHGDGDVIEPVLAI
jgi:hypothetical protein